LVIGIVFGDDEGAGLLFGLEGGPTASAEEAPTAKRRSKQTSRWENFMAAIRVYGQEHQVSLWTK
jgi:hypothetical protein